MIQEKGVSAKRTQADHSRRESLMSNPSQEPRASGKLATMFSSGNKEPGNQFKSSVFKHADPSNLGKSLLVWRGGGRQRRPPSLQELCRFTIDFMQLRKRKRSGR